MNSQSRRIYYFLSFFIAMAACSALCAQGMATATLEAATSASAAAPLLSDVASVANSGLVPSSPASVVAALPDAPSTVLLASTSVEPFILQDPYNPKARPAGPHIAPLYTKYIPADWTAQRLSARNKAVLGLRDLYSPFTFLGDLASAGYSDLTDGQPNYGVNEPALGKRIGATVVRDATEGIFTDAIFAPLLHEDPRYYVEGPRHNLVQRVVYAGTRTIVTRTDSGRSSVNGAELLGYAGASALSYTYYPQINKNFKDTAFTFGGGLGGSAIGFIVSEFSDQVLQALHLEKKN